MSKRKREVFPTGEIAHLWAHQSQLGARNPQGNFSFAGLELRSYSTVIARLVKGKGGHMVALHANRSWSNTTNGHQSAGRSATSHLASIDVADWDCDRRGKVDHKANLKDFRQRIADQAAKVQRARDRKYYEFIVLDDLLNDARGYCQAFGLATQFDTPADFDRHAEDAKAREYRATAQQRQAERDRKRQERWTKERQEREAAAKMSTAELLEKWLAGESCYASRFRELPTAYARIRGDMLETTLGARVPLEHVRRAIPIVLRLIERGEAYQRNGHTIHLGHYALDSIDTAGTVRAGCHTFQRAEVERIAAELAKLPAQEPQSELQPA